MSTEKDLHHQNPEAEQQQPAPQELETEERVLRRSEILNPHDRSNLALVYYLEDVATEFMKVLKSEPVGTLIAKVDVKMTVRRPKQS
jgi:hypothetical protein|tara:strand:- start:4671 stop:4931 length:261 start_codon:yes stop_codon:yes gene_type:complete